MGHYPPDIMSKCEGQGIFGHCGTDCPIFIDGDCPIEDEVKESIKDESMEKVNHPKHYNEHPAGIECIDVIEEFGFNLGSVVKYVWRAGLKPGENDLDDLRKAEWYIKREIQRREKQLKENRDGQ